MPNPFRSLRYLPWASLFLSAGLTVLVATAIDVVFIWALINISALETVLAVIPFLPQLMFIAAPFGVGALAIFLTLQFFRQIILRTDTIWALVGCLILILLAKGWLLVMIPGLFLKGFSIVTVIMVMLGSFTAGRRYWR